MSIRYDRWSRRSFTHGHSDHARSGHRQGHGNAADARHHGLALRRRISAGEASRLQSFGEEPSKSTASSVSFHPAGHVLGSAQIADGEETARASSPPAITSAAPDPTCRGLCAGRPAMSSSPKRPSRLPVFRHPDPPRRDRQAARIAPSSFPSARISSAPMRLARPSASSVCCAMPVTAEPIYIHGATGDGSATIISRAGHRSRQPWLPATTDDRPRTEFRLQGRRRRRSVVGLSPIAGRGAFNEPLPRLRLRLDDACASARKPAAVSSCRSFISDHCDWPELTETITELSPAEVWVTHGREEALVRWCELQGIKARPLHLVGYEDEGD